MRAGYKCEYLCGKSGSVPSTACRLAFPDQNRAMFPESAPPSFPQHQHPVIESLRITALTG